MARTYMGGGASGENASKARRHTQSAAMKRYHTAEPMTQAKRSALRESGQHHRANELMHASRAMTNAGLNPSVYSSGHFRNVGSTGHVPSKAAQRGLTPQNDYRDRLVSFLTENLAPFVDLVPFRNAPMQGPSSTSYPHWDNTGNQYENAWHFMNSKYNQGLSSLERSANETSDAYDEFFDTARTYWDRWRP